ncbi:MAG: hypothetical protein R2762_19260 [Bryobacteraceae bacterium]
MSDCAHCGAAVAPDAMNCGECGHLLHGDLLRDLHAEAVEASNRGEASEELRLWRASLDLLPPGTQQHSAIKARVDALSEAIDKGEAAEGGEGPGNWVKKGSPAAGAALLLLWKFKTVALLALTKGKLLLFGLTKLSTLSSMLVSFGAYWALYGWMFGLGLVLSIYVHEMGHVWALRQLGFAASAPMFIPLMGAVVRLYQRPSSPREDARIGLGGPIWGTVGAAATFALYYASGKAVIGTVAHFAAWINLLNLIPVWQLDGSRAFAALARPQRVMALVAIGVCFAAGREGLLVALAAAAGFRLFTKDCPPQGDAKTLYHYCGLVAALAAMTAIPFPDAPPR